MRRHIRLARMNKARRSVRSIGMLVAWAGAALMSLGIFGAVAVALVFEHYAKDLPSIEKLAQYSPAVVTRLYAADGRLLAEYAKEKRIFVPLKAIPDTVIDAFISAEDRNFYSHKGIDIYGIARAITENVQNYGSGRSMVGGSTITQQVVKNFLLTNEKSLERKIKEAILAYRVSKVFTKEQILELYLNEIYLGKGSYGVAAAALNYFDKSLGELSTEELALLAAMPKAPANYNPATRYDAALARRNYVIGRMQEDGYINEAEARRALAMPIMLRERSEDEVAHADFFAEEVRRQLAESYGDAALYAGGLTVKTTLNPAYQEAADKALRHALVMYDRRHGYRGALRHLPQVAGWEQSLATMAKTIEAPLYEGEQLALVLEATNDKATIGLADGSRGVIALSELTWARKDIDGPGVGAEVRRASDVLAAGDVIIAQPIEGKQGQFSLRQVPKVNGAMVVMDPHNGRVLAMSGGYSYQGSEFNRATQARRQPGSSFKPVVYLTALENGFTPSTIIMDEPIEISQGPGKPLWRPQNYEGSYLGPATLRTGLERSRNAMTVRLAQMLGLGRIINVAKRLGVYDGKVPRNYSMVLGAYETTLMRMVTAYSMIANGGRRVQGALIERIDDRDGDIIYRRDKRQCPACQIQSDTDSAIVSTPPALDDDREIVIDPRVAYQLEHIMEGVVQRGTATAALAVGKPLAGKTGTTNDSRDAWFIGYSPDLVAGVYVGFDTPQSLGGKETGGRVALPGFVEFMKTALADKPATAFRVPQGVMMVQVDHNNGMPPYPGMPNSGKMITEAFLVGGNIYKPPLPEDAEDEGIRQGEANSFGEVDEGFDPYAGWEDTDHYMSPQKAQMQDYQYQQEHGGAPEGLYPFGGPTPPPAGSPSPYQPAPEPPAEGYPVDNGSGQQEESPSGVIRGTGGLY